MDMQAGNVPYQSVSSLSSLKLLKKLTVGQRDLRSPEELSQYLNSSIFPEFGRFTSTLYLLDHITGTYIGTKKSDAARKDSLRLPVNAPVVAELKKIAFPLVVQRTPETSIFKIEPETQHILIPIFDNGDLFGFIHLIGDQKQPQLHPGQLDTLQTLADIVGSRLKSLATINQVKESMQALEYSEKLRTALYEISEQAYNSENLSDLYPRMHKIISRLIYAENFYISIIEDRSDGQYITFPYFMDTCNPEFHGMEIQLTGNKQPVTAYLLKTGQPLLISPENYQHVHEQFRLDFLGTQPHSWLGAPFYLGRLAGAVAVVSYENVTYTEKDKELIAFVARHIGEALKRKQGLAELRAAKDRAELAEKKKSAFLANMSHEIRTPMNGILGLTELVLDSGISGQNRTYMDMVRSSAERLLKLINDILDFSKIEAGKFELTNDTFSLRNTIADVYKILAISAASKNISLSVDYDPEIPDLLRGDADKLAQILTNLISNGIKFTKAGSVTLTIKKAGITTNRRVPVNFCIRDTGIGIPESQINNVFKAFSQIGTTRDSNNQGTGLGLVIAAEFVEMMGGKICVESKPGEGTSFYFTIPLTLTEDDTTSLALRKQSEPSSPATDFAREMQLKILLVEDEYINRTLASAVLMKEGWEITTAENGYQALTCLNNQSFDLVLMDVQMPELDGFATTRTIRQQEKSTGTHQPIIAMTAYAIKGDREKCLTSGMDGYIAKPIRPEILREEIKKVLHKTSEFAAR